MAALRILSIVGSPRPTSRVRVGLEALRAALAELGVENPVWNLGQTPLPFMDPDTRGQPEPRDPNLARFLALARASDGYVLGSPIYHNSYSGWLKNAIDHLSSRDLAGKAFGLASHGGHRSQQAVDHLRIIVRSVQGVAIPTNLCTDEEDFTQDEEGELHLTALPIIERVRRLAEELAEFTALLRARRNGELAQFRARTGALTGAS